LASSRKQVSGTLLGIIVPNNLLEGIGDLDSFENITPLKSKHNGYRDIQVSITLNAGKKVEKSKFVFNGAKYELKK
jgi:hypothetical protein